MNIGNEIRFVNFQGPSQVCNAADAKTTRQHVRRAVIRKRRTGDLHDRIRQYDGLTFSNGVSAPKVTNNLLISTKAQETSAGKTWYHKQLRTSPASSGDSVGWNHVRAHDLLMSGLTIQHPYTAYAALCVDIPVGRIDFLLKSYAYRNAAEPLFDTNHVDSDLRMDVVFPGCLKADAFLNALFYSIVRTASLGQRTPEALRLKARALEGLRMATSSGNQALTYSDIGTIMILKGDAYKWNDDNCHQAHALGLSRIIRPDTKASCLTPLAERAVFWQDVTAALIFDSKQYAPRLTLPQVHWRREFVSGPRTIPRGFLEHRNVIPNDLLDCIEDIVELQEVLLSNDNHATDFFDVDNMQASIESRLACQGLTCKALGPIAECCRLAAFTICFLACTETWNNVLVPCKLSDKLRRLLHDSLENSIWMQHRALQVWLLLVGSCTASLDRGHVEGLKEKWYETLNRFTRYFSTLPGSEMDSQCITSALEDFIYCGDWLQIRREVRGWPELETTFA